MSLVTEAFPTDTTGKGPLSCISPLLIGVIAITVIMCVCLTDSSVHTQ